MSILSASAWLPVYWLGEDLVRFPCFVQLLEIDRNYGVEGDTETPRHSLTSTSLHTIQLSSSYDLFIAEYLRA